MSIQCIIISILTYKAHALSYIKVIYLSKIIHREGRGHLSVRVAWAEHLGIEREQPSASQSPWFKPQLCPYLLCMLGLIA